MKALAAFGVLLMTCGVAEAQPAPANRPFEISAAVSLVSPRPEHAYPQFPPCDSHPQGPCSTPATFPQGGRAISVGYGFNRWLAIIAGFSGYNNKEFPSGVAEVNHAHSFTAGPRFMVPVGEPGKGLRIFVQLPIGLVRSNVLGQDFVWQPGAGLDFPAKGLVAVRLEIDRSIVAGAGRNLSASSALAGVVLRFGSRR